MPGKGFAGEIVREKERGIASDLMDNPEMAAKQKTAGGKASNNKNKTGIAVIFGIIEAVSLVLWQTADDFSGSSAYWIHFCSKCGFLAGGAYLAHEFTQGIVRRVFVWVAFVIFCATLFVIKPIQSTIEPGQQSKSPEILTAITTNNFESDNPTTSISIYLTGQTVMQFAEIYKGQPSELAFEASNQLTNHHPKCCIYLFEKAESYYENDPAKLSPGWRQRRPDCLCVPVRLGVRPSAAHSREHFGLSNPKSDSMRGSHGACLASAVYRW